MTGPTIIGVDIGATSIKAACFQHGLEPSAHTRVPTPAKDGAAAVLDAVVTAIDEVLPDEGPTVIGIGSCGLVDGSGLVLGTTATMPGWDGTDIPREITARTGLFAVADNDGNVAALAEATTGAGVGCRSVAMLTLGTGVGGGLVIDGAIVHGAGAMAGQFGHMKVDPAGPPCPCGRNGCLEAYASAWAVRKSTGLDAKEAFERAARGEQPHAEAVSTLAWALGITCADLAHALNPDVIVIGGGVASGFAQFEHRVLETYRQTALVEASSTTRIARATLGPDAGVIGAAVLARAHPEPRRST